MSTQSTSTQSISTQSRTVPADRSNRARPVHEIRFGQVRAAIWENQTEKGIRHNVTVSRSYKVGDQWKDSSSFSRDDLLLLAKMIDACHTWILAQPTKSQTAPLVNGDGCAGIP